MKVMGRRVVGAIAAGFALLLLLSAMTTWLILRTQQTADLVAHTLRVELALSHFSTLAERVEAARRGFLLSGDERFVTNFEGAADQIPAALGELSALIDDNPAQRERADRLEAVSADHLALLRQSIEERRRSPEAPFVVSRPTQLIGEIRDLSVEMTREERGLLRERTARQDRISNLSYVFLAAGGLVLLIVAAGTIWASRRNMMDLQRSRDSLSLLNDDLEGAVATRTADLQRANDEIQRFAYIVSHDLRSPLVNVMGFTSELDAATRTLSELVERADTQVPGLVGEEARLAIREDLPEAIGFIRSSTQKMDRLINAILRLSREGRRVIAPETLDMNEVVRGIVDSLQHRLTENGAQIEMETLPTIVSDRVAVEQIFSNLIENAVKYLKAGRPGVIKVRGKRVGNRALFEIEDNGRGIDPKDHDRVFDLFRRSGAQDQPGEGIGLAHVRAMVYRLNGLIACQSALDEGATFRLSMQADLSSTEGSSSTQGSKTP